MGSVPPIGEFLLKRKKFKPSVLEVALQIQKITNKRIGNILVEMGVVTPDDIQEYLGIYNPNALLEERSIHSIIPREVLKKYNAVVLSESKDIIFVSALDLSVKKVLEKYTNKKVQIVPISLESYLNEIYSSKKVESYAKGNDPNILLDSLLKEAVKEGTADIHVEIMRDFTAIRFRIGGTLRTRYIFDKTQGELLISRVKGIANLDISEKRYPQDGAFSYVVFSRPIDIRVSTMPGVLGEALVMRILDKIKVVRPLESLGMFGLDKWKKAIHQHNGVILVTGPTGSGKSTTLYATMLYLDRIGKNIITIEDPVEYHFPFIRQVQVNHALNLDFASFLKYALRQDPDIILVGEVRDEETARIMIQAAETGHLVFATLHAGNIPTAFSRLISLGIKDYELAYTLRCISSQTLVRKACSNCKGTGLVDNNQICPVCNGEGLSTRLVLINEIMSFTPELVRRFYNQDVPKYTTIKDNARKLLNNGIITEQQFRDMFGE